MLDLCDSLKAKAICGVLLSLVGNAGTLITYTIGKDTLHKLGWMLKKKNLSSEVINQF